MEDKKMGSFTTASKRFKYGSACLLISVLLSFAIMLGFNGGRGLEMASIIIFMVGIALVIEVD